jgi:hypothetical protein
MFEGFCCCFGLCFCGFSVLMWRGDGMCVMFVNGMKWVYVKTSRR